MNHRYADLAWERSVWVELRRHLQEAHLAGGGTSKQAILCEALPYELREVPNEVIAAVLMRLERQEDLLTRELGRYDFRLRNEGPIGGLLEESIGEEQDGDRG